MTRQPRRRVLGALLAVTLLVVVLDLSGAALPARLREAAAAVAGPAQRLAAAADGTEVDRLRAETEVLRAQLAQRDAQLARAGAVADLLRAPFSAAARVVPARVVAFKTSAPGGRTVTLDVGARDGIEPNLTVVAAGGLVGRVVTVAPWTSDVRLLGGADATVGVRVGAAGPLGTVSATPPPDAPARPPGGLTLTLVEQGGVAVGDLVTTLGSVDDRPYLPDVVVGTVTAIDPPRGRLVATAVVRPAVDAATIDVVAVLLSPGRDQPRPAATGAR